MKRLGATPGEITLERGVFLFVPIREALSVGVNTAQALDSMDEMDWMDDMDNTDIRWKEICCAVHLVHPVHAVQPLGTGPFQA